MVDSPAIENTLSTGADDAEDAGDGTNKLFLTEAFSFSVALVDVLTLLTSRCEH